MELKFNNITISGGVAVGKNTLLDNLKLSLQPEGWKFTSGGQLNRDFTKENISPHAANVSEEFNRYIEQRTEDLLTKEGHYVIEAWLAGFVAREFKDTLRILLVCKDDRLRIDRVANRDRITIAEAKEVISKRENENFKEWRRIYGDYDFFSPEYYHLVIDTYSSGPMETVGIVLDKLGYKK
ncbi:MAG: cytidylate kinase family protein [Weeksellaceae bacterium]